MSIYAPDPRAAKRRDAFLALLIISVFALFIAGAGFALGIEPRLVLERSAGGSFRGTGSNHFAGRQFFSKTVEGITGVQLGSAKRDRSSDSVKDRQRQSRQRHLDLYGADRARLGWDRESDQGLIEDFMRGKEPRLALADPPPPWRKGVSWFCFGFAGLLVIGGIQSNFFPKKNAA